jgi:hypothetical protein
MVSLGLTSGGCAQFAADEGEDGQQLEAGRGAVVADEEV